MRTFWIFCALVLVCFITWAILTDKNRSAPTSAAVGKSTTHTTTHAEPRGANAIMPPLFGPEPKLAAEPLWHLEMELLRKDARSTLILITTTVVRPQEMSTPENTATEHRAAFAEFGPVFIKQWLTIKHTTCTVASGGFSFADYPLVAHSSVGAATVLRMSVPITCPGDAATGITDDLLEVGLFRDSLGVLLKTPADIRAKTQELLAPPKTN